MDNAQDSTSQPTGAVSTADSTAATGQDAETISKARFDGVMSAMGRRTRERDEARAELDALRARVAAGEVVPAATATAAVAAGPEPEAQDAEDDVDAAEAQDEMTASAFIPAVANPATHIDRNAAPRHALRPAGGGGVPLSVIREQFAKAAERENIRLRAEVESAY